MLLSGQALFLRYWSLITLKLCDFRGYMVWVENSKENLRRVTHENLANGFEMRISGLNLLREGMNIAKAALKSAIRKYRIDASLFVNPIGDFYSEMYGVGSGESDAGPVWNINCSLGAGAIINFS